MIPEKKDFFYEMTLRICGSLHLEVAMSNTIAYLKEFIPTDEMYMCLFEYDRQIYRIIAKATENDGVLMNDDHILPPDAVRATEEFDLNQVIVIKDLHEDPVLSSLFSDKYSKNLSCMVLPLSIEKNLVGVILLFSAGENVYGEKHAELLTTVASPFGIAFSNALVHLEQVRLKQRLYEENNELKQKIQNEKDQKVIGKDNGLKEVYKMANLVAPLNSPVLITGETGTGKEVIANAIHQSSQRANGPFVKVNCGAIPETLLDSELFGHEKGAFTGSTGKKIGRFERAHTGTIFLDEVGELTMEAQTRLLRVIQEREIERVGGVEPIDVDIRILCATNKDLNLMVKEGKFREDLLFRINVFPIPIPPLRQRKEDIPLLVEHFVEVKSQEIGLRTVPKISDKQMEKLINYLWPGNVRELQNIIERSIIINRDSDLEFDNLLSSDTTSGVDTIHPPLSLDSAMKEHIMKALEKSGGKINGKGGAAAILNINPNTLRNRMKKLGIKY